jgi:hypothetical protein
MYSVAFFNVSLGTCLTAVSFAIHSSPSFALVAAGNKKTCTWAGT